MSNSDPIAPSKPQWVLPLVPSEDRDPLLGCLLWILKFYQLVYPVEQLIVGLPLEKGFLTVPLLKRAANKAQCRATLIRKSLAEIPPLLCPMILLLKDRQACVVAAIKETEVEIVFHEKGSPSWVSKEELAQYYQGYAVVIAPIVKLDERTQSASLDTEGHWLWSVIKQTWPVYSEILIASFFINIFTVASSLFTMNVYDRVVPNHAIETLWVLAAGILIVYGFDFILKLLRAYFIDVVGKKCDIILSAAIHEQLINIQMSVRPDSVGSFANTVHQFEAFREFFTSATMATFIDLPFALLFLMIIAWIGGSVVWVPAIVLPCVILVVYMIQKPLYRTVKESYRYSGQKHALLVETLTGVETLKTVNAQGVRQAQWEKIVARASELGMQSKFWAQLAMQFTGFVQQTAQVGVVIIGVYQIIANEMTMGALIACTLLTSRALLPMSQLASLLTRYQQAFSSLKGLDDVMRLETEKPAQEKMVLNQRLRGAIQFKAVEFTYPKQKEPALKKIHLSIAPGEKVAIIGRIGSGKSTLEKLLLRLYEPTSGQILLDGTEIRQLDTAYVRSQIGYCPQDVMLFYGSIRQNVLLGQFIEEQSALVRACHLAGIGEFVFSHPEGMDRQVGERGEKLSGGQRQAIVLARALLKDPPVLVLDEPTSMMDDITEIKVLQRLKAILPSKTLLLITHKTRLLELVDRIVVMSSGEIVADGPKELILEQLKAGKFRTSSGDHV